MKEREINFNINRDHTLVEDKDGKLKKSLEKVRQDVLCDLNFCYEELQNGRLTEGMKETCFSLTESYVQKFLDDCGYDGVLKKKSEERYQEIRSLNEENRELRKQLGGKVSNEDAREKMKNIAEMFKRWWNIYGLGYVSELVFTEYGCIKATLGGMVCESYYNGKDESEKNKWEYLNNIGFELSSENTSKYVLATDSNIQKLEELIKDKFPSAKLQEFRITNYQNIKMLRNIEIAITNLDDFNAIDNHEPDA